MQIGAVLSQNEFGDLAQLRDYAQAVQGLGYDFLVTSDHVVGADPAGHPGLPRVFDIENLVHEPLMLFAYLTGAAPGLGLLTSVIILPQRQTVLVAKQAAELDLMTGGRLRLGVGIGWNEVEFEALGMAFRNRARRFEEQFDLLRRLWTNQLVTFPGRYHTLTTAGLNPLPIQRPIPLWIGASAEAAVKRATVIADGYLPLRPLDGGWQATMDKVHGWLAEAGRDPATFGIEGRLDAGKESTLASWQASIDMWRRFGASHLSVSTSGLGDVDEHIARLRELRPALTSS